MNFKAFINESTPFTRIQALNFPTVKQKIVADCRPALSLFSRGLMLYRGSRNNEPCGYIDPTTSDRIPSMLDNGSAL